MRHLILLIPPVLNPSFPLLKKQKQRMMEKYDPTQKLYNRMRLWEFPDQYILEPTDGSFSPFLAVNRFNGTLNLTDDLPPPPPHPPPKIWTIFGVVGILKLLAGMSCFYLFN